MIRPGKVQGKLSDELEERLCRHGLCLLRDARFRPLMTIQKSKVKANS
jgi:hypothetical protein